MSELEQHVEGTPAPPTPAPRRDRLLWLGLLVAPSTWAMDLMVSYALVGPACHSGNEWYLYAVSALALVIALTGALAGYVGLNDSTPADLSTRKRVQFMGWAGVGMSVFFALVIIAEAIPHFALRPCER